MNFTPFVAGPGVVAPAALAAPSAYVACVLDAPGYPRPSFNSVASSSILSVRSCPWSFLFIL
ncbi:hypothetical protein, partial [Burkholderia cepacia]|uniref:hypothetical protein n=1 Tax=Burkholderia cepacia TaxID=292 RepID=UPI001D008032